VAQTHGVSVGALLRSRLEALGLSLDLLAGGDGLERVITSPHVQKTGLALAGFHEYLKPGRILIFGESEIRFLESLDPRGRSDALPLLKTATATPTAIAKIESILEDSLAERTVLHAVLLDVLGLGVLIAGDSGIGKSECALDLIVRGHRLVADDTVEIRRRSETILIGTCPDLTRHHMELRGLGVINVKELFGIASTRSSKRVELVVQLERWDPLRQYERLGLDDEHFEILGLHVPLIRMPVAPGRNIAILVEVAARNQLLRARGHHAARILAARLEDTLRQAASVAASNDLPEEDDEEDIEGGGLR